MADHRSKARLLAALIAALSLLLAAACTSSDDGDDTSGSDDDGGGEDADVASAEGLDEATIGVILPETGNLSVPAGEIRLGMETAIELWNTEVGSPQLSLEVCDDAGEPERSLTCIDRFESEGVEIISGPHFGTTWLNAEEVLAESGAFDVTGTPAAVPPADSNLFTSGTPAPVALEMAFGEFADRGDETVGMLHTTDGTAQSAADAADEIAEENDLVLEKADYANDAPSALPEAQQLLAADPDVVLIWSTGPSAVTGLRALDEAGYDGPVVMNYSNAGPGTYALAGDAVPEDLSMIGTRSMVGEVDDPERAELVEGFLALYEPENGVASFNVLSAADIVIVAGFAAANGSTPEEMAAYLESGAAIPGIAVPFQYSEDSHVGSDDPSALRLVALRDDVWEPAEA